MAPNMAKMLKEAQKLEKGFAEVREALAEVRVEGSAGGGEMNGQRDVVSISIAPDAIEGGDNEMLEDLLVSALRDAKQKSDEIAASEMAKVTGGMLPPGMG